MVIKNIKFKLFLIIIILNNFINAGLVRKILSFFPKILARKFFHFNKERKFYNKINENFLSNKIIDKNEFFRLEKEFRNKFLQSKVFSYENRNGSDYWY